MTGKPQATKKPKQKAEDRSTESRTLAEWVTLLVSIAIVAGVFIVVTYLYVAGDGHPVVIGTDVQLDHIRVAGETFYLPVVVFNEGDSAAGNVQIQAELAIGEEIETSEFSINSLSGNDSETGVVAFSGDPRDGELTARVASYIE